MIGLYVNNNTEERFAFQLVCGLKTIETRTKRAAKAFLNSGVKVGQRIAIIARGKVYGYATFDGVKEYPTEAAFRADEGQHKVKPGSAFDFDEKKGKVGLMFSDPKTKTLKDRDIVVRRTHGYTYTEI